MIPLSSMIAIVGILFTALIGALKLFTSRIIKAVDSQGDKIDKVHEKIEATTIKLMEHKTYAAETFMTKSECRYKHDD